MLDLLEKPSNASGAIDAGSADCAEAAIRSMAVTAMRDLMACGVDHAEEVLLSHEQADCSVVHHFGPGVYIREVHLKAGLMAIGHYQKFEHVNVMLQGRVLMHNDDGSTTELVAPLMFVGKPGRKAGLILEDVVWQNIYATTETDIEKLEAHFILKTPEFCSKEASRMASLTGSHEGDRLDYAAALHEFGSTDETARTQSQNTADQIEMPRGSWKVKTGQSPIDGVGLFATSRIEAGEFIAPARIGGVRTPAGRYTNHSSKPNAEIVLSACGDANLYATRPIRGCAGGQDGEEVTVDYRKSPLFHGINPKTIEVQA